MMRCVNHHNLQGFGDNKGTVQNLQYVECFNFQTAVFRSYADCIIAKEILKGGQSWK